MQVVTFCSDCVTQMVMTTRGCKPMTPPPLPSHLGIGARHTGHLHKYQASDRYEDLFNIPRCKSGNSHARRGRSYGGEQAFTTHDVTTWREGRVGG